MARRTVATARRTVNPRRNVRRRRRLARALGADRARASARTRPRDPSLSVATPPVRAHRPRGGGKIASAQSSQTAPWEPWQLGVLGLNASDYFLGMEAPRAAARG